MDLERIKQNLRLRSGRPKKAPKRPKPQTQLTTDQNTQTELPPSSEAPQTNRKPDSPARDTSPAKFATSQPKLEDFGVEKNERLEKADSGIGSSPSGGDQKRSQIESTTSDSIELKDSGDPEPEAGQSMANSSQDNATGQEQPAQPLSKNMDEPSPADASGDSEVDNFDLKPPAPKPKPPSVESLSELLFSSGHLNTLIYNPSLLPKFTAFLQRYRPEDYPLLLRYLETSKAITAIEYANAVADSAPALPKAVEGNEVETSNTAAVLDDSFRQSCASAYDTLVNTSLPLYVTYLLVRIISECLVDEITGSSTPYMREMVGGLSEVFCLTDPNQEDNPIIYASEEFYRLTGYGQEDVIGHNCRFLQGPKTKRDSPRRLRESLDSGEEAYETLLNYRRDGKPFINVLMIAPLHDAGGNVKYNIGAQVDVSKLVEQGRVMDGFQKYLAKRESDKRRETRENARPTQRDAKKKRALEKLRELSELFDLEESAVVQSHSRSSSMERDEDVKSVASGNARRRLNDSEDEDDESEEEQEGASGQSDWKLGESGPSGMSGKLPGVYERYMLVRPAPSLRIIFVSPKMRKTGHMIHSPFMSHVAATSSTLSGLLESFKEGTPVSAKIHFTPLRGEQRNGTRISANDRHEDGRHGRACWISATPLLGSDDSIGVWMIVFVEKAQAKSRRVRAGRTQTFGTLKQQVDKTYGSDQTQMSAERQVPTSTGLNQKKEDEKREKSSPIKPKRLDEAIHIPSQYQDDGQQTATAYQHQAVTPVEEYHSADEEGGIIGSAGASANRGVQSPAPEYELGGEGDFVHTVQSGSRNLSPYRVLIDADADRDEEDQAEEALPRREERDVQDFDGDHSKGYEQEVVDSKEDPHSFQSDTRTPIVIEKSEQDERSPSRPTTSGTERPFGTESAETIRHQSPNESGSEHSSPTDGSSEERPALESKKSHQSHVARQSGNLPAGLGYMDYLSHPGTSNRKRAGERERGRRRFRADDGKEFWVDDDDCLLSPYSVD